MNIFAQTQFNKLTQASGNKRVATWPTTTTKTLKTSKATKTTNASEREHESLTQTTAASRYTTDPIRSDQRRARGFARSNSIFIFLAHFWASLLAAFSSQKAKNFSLSPIGRQIIMQMPPNISVGGLIRRVKATHTKCACWLHIVHFVGQLSAPIAAQTIIVALVVCVCVLLCAALVNVD